MVQKNNINEKRKESYICECGSSLRITEKNRHCKSKKHQNFIKIKL